MYQSIPTLASFMQRVSEMSNDTLGKFMLFNPTSNRPPRKVFDSYDKAVEAAKRFVPKYGGGKIYVVQRVAVAEVEPQPVKVTTMEEKIANDNVKFVADAFETFFGETI